jgi:hypothetical protein
MDPLRPTPLGLLYPAVVVAVVLMEMVQHQMEVREMDLDPMILIQMVEQMVCLGNVPKLVHGKDACLLAGKHLGIYQHVTVGIIVHL